MSKPSQHWPGPLALLAIAILFATLTGDGTAQPAVGICDTSNCATIKIAVGSIPIGVGLAGNGRGTVTSEPAGINCTVTGGLQSGTCEYQFVWPLSKSDLKVTLTYRPATGSFVDVPGFSPVEVAVLPVPLTPGSSVSVNYAVFTLTTHRLDVSMSGAGTGRVVIEGWKECRQPCSTVLNYGKQVKLKAVADAGAVFKTWTGACNGQGATCTLTIKQATSTNGVFDLASSGGGGSTPPSAPPPTQPPTSGASTDTTVEAQVVAARAGRSKLGARLVRVELDLGEDAAVTLRLMRSGKQLASRSFARVREGNRILTLLVPPRVTKGQATLRVELTDTAGNRRGARRTVSIPRS